MRILYVEAELDYVPFPHHVLLPQQCELLCFASFHVAKPCWAEISTNVARKSSLLIVGASIVGEVQDEFFSEG